jgi:hypothetical protein
MYPNSGNKKSMKKSWKQSKRSSSLWAKTNNTLFKDGSSSKKKNV